MLLSCAEERDGFRHADGIRSLRYVTECVSFLRFRSEIWFGDILKMDIGLDDLHDTCLIAACCVPNLI